MEITMSRESCRLLLTVRKEDEQQETFEDRMMSNMQSEVLLPFSVQYEDAVSIYRYDVTGLTAYTDFVSQQTLPYDMLNRLITCISEMIGAVDEYLLNLDSILLSPEYIFTDRDMQHVKFAYVPGYHKAFSEALRELAGDLLERADYDDRSCVFLVYELYRIVKAPDFQPDQLRNLPTAARLSAGQMETEKRNEQPYEPEDAPEEITESEETAPEGEESSFLNSLFTEKTQDPWKKKTDILPHHFSVPLAMTGFCLLILILYNGGVMENAVKAAGLTVSAQLLAVLLMAAGCAVLFLIVRRHGRPLWQRKKKEEVNEFWGDLLKGNYAYDEAIDDEPVRKPFHRN